MTTVFKKDIFSAAAIITAISVIVGATFSIENRYAKATQLVQLKEETKLLLDYNRKQQLEDKLFELRLQSNPDSFTKAMIKRYEEQLTEVVRRLNKRN